MAAVEIEYCVPCGYREQAETIQAEILDVLEEDVDKVALVPGDGTVIIVRVDGEQVYQSKDDVADTAEVNEGIVDAVQDAIEG